MTSRNSFCKLVRQELIRRLWAVTLALLGVLAGLTLPVVFCIRTYYLEAARIAESGAYSVSPDQSLKTLLADASAQIQSVLDAGNPFIKLVLIVLAILCGVAMFRYLHDRRQVDFYHSLPISRGRLFWVRYVTGAAAVLPVYLLVLLLTLAAAWGMGFGGALSAAGIAAGVLSNLAFFLLNYTVAVLCTVLTGNTIITVLLGCWAEFGLPAAALIIRELMNITFETFVTTPAWLEFLLRNGSPIVRYLMTSTEAVGLPFAGRVAGVPVVAAALGALAAAAALTALAYVLFLRRRSERAGTAIAFQPMQEPLKWFLCAVVGLAAGFFFLALMDWFWFGLIAGLILCHMLVEIIYAFDFKAILHHWKRILVLLVAVVGGTAVFRMDLMHYDTYLPPRDAVASAGVDLHGNWSTHNDLSASYRQQLTDPAALDAIYELAQQGVAAVGTEAEPESGYGDVTVRFTLKSGRTVDRCYTRLDYAAAQEPVRALMTSEAYLRTCAALQTLALPETDAQGWANLSLRTNATAYGSRPDVVVQELDDVRAVVQALQQAQIDNREAHLSEAPVLRMDLEIQWEERYYDAEARSYRRWDTLTDVPIYPSDTLALDVIRQLTGLTPHELTAADVRALDVFVAPQADYDAAYEARDTGVTAEDAQAVETFRAAHTTYVTDPAAIDALLQHAVQDTSLYLAGMDFAREIDFDGLYVEISADLGNDRGVGLFYPAGQAPLDVLRAYLK